MISHLNVRKNVITTVFAFLINIFLTFIGYRLLIEQGGLEALGLWSIISAAIFVMRIGDIGMGGAAERYMATISINEDSKLIREYFDTALIINILLFGFLSILGWYIFSKNITFIISESINLQKEALKILPLMFFVFFVSNVANVFSGGLRGLHLGYLGAYISIVSNLLQMGLIIYLVPNIGIIGLAWAQLAQYTLTLIMTWIVMHQYMQSKSSFTWLPVYASKKIINILFNFSIKAQFVSLINGLFEPLSKFLVGHTTSIENLGIYELAYKIVSLPRNAVVSGALSMMPAITRLLNEDKKEARKLYFRSKKIVLFSTLMVLICVVIASPLFSLILLDEINWYLVVFIVMLSIGYLGNVIGAPAYILGFSSGKLFGNFISSILVLIILPVSTLMTNQFFYHSGLIFSTICLFLGGLIVKNINEKILYRQ